MGNYSRALARLSLIPNYPTQKEWKRILFFIYLFLKKKTFGYQNVEKVMEYQ